MAKKDKKDDLDTTTTFADMNIEGFRWYDPSRKKGAKPKRKVTRKEYWQMVRGMFAAVLPYVCIFLIAVGIVGFLLYWWLI